MSAIKAAQVEHILSGSYNVMTALEGNDYAEEQNSDEDTLGIRTDEEATDEGFSTEEESEESSTHSNADEKSAMQQLRRFSTERRANIGIENGSLRLNTPLFQPVFRELDSSFCPDNGRNRQDELL